MKSKNDIVSHIRSRPDRYALEQADIAEYNARQDDTGGTNAVPCLHYSILAVDRFFDSVGLALDGQSFQAALSRSTMHGLLSDQLKYYWHFRFRLLFSGHPQPLKQFSHESAIQTMASCFFLGWTDEAVRQGYLTHAALNRGYQLVIPYEEYALKGHAFMLRLFADWRGDAHHAWPSNSRGEPTYEAILLHWRDNNPEILSNLLVQACNRHVQEANARSRKPVYEFGGAAVMRFPLEVLLVYRLRELIGLSTPLLEHELMDEPFRRPLAAKPVPELGELEQATMRRVRMDWPDFDEVTSLRQLTILAAG